MAIVVTDIVSLAIFLFPSSFIGNMFDMDALYTGDGLEIALSGILGVICTGFVNVLGLAICLLSPIKINKFLIFILSAMFIICAFLTGQRTPMAGIIIVFLALLLKNKFKGFLALVVVGFTIAAGLSWYSKYAEDEAVNALAERYIDRVDILKSGDSGRNDQYQILNDQFLLGFLVGDGVGRHSPENPEAQVAMPDAMVFRIYNEMGIIGLTAFLLFFALNIRVAIKKRNWFMIAIISYAFFANCFNRVLFVAPVSILPYLFIGLFNWRWSPKLEELDNGARLNQSAYIKKYK